MCTAIVCGAPETMDEEPSVGSICADHRTWCHGDEEILRCFEGRWTTLSCHELCAPGSALGCDFEDDRAACACEAPESVWSCEDDETLLECSEGRCLAFDCDEVCAAELDGWSSTGCFAGNCLCSAEGTPCPADATPRCAGPFEIHTCEEGVWVSTDCMPTCDDPTTARCRTDPDGQPMCRCDGT